MARTPSSSEPAVMSRGDRAALWLTAGFAGAVAVVAAVAIVVAALDMLGEGPLEVPDMPIDGGRVPELTEAFAEISTARYDTVTITLPVAPDSARWLLLAGLAVSTLATIGVCLTLLWLCLRVLGGRPFGRSVTVALVASSVLIILGGTASQLLASAGRASVVTFLGEGATTGDSPGFIDYALTLNLAPIGVGVALAVIALAFQIGARFQRDTEGLV